MRISSRTVALVAITVTAACEGPPEGAEEETADDQVAEAALTQTGRRCGTPAPHPAKAALADEIANLRSGRAAAPAAGALHVPVAVHVIASARTKAKGYVSDTLIKKQIDVLNDAYRGGQRAGGPATAFTFDLLSIDRTVDAAWFAMMPGSREEATAKRALRVGDAKTLNLYLAAPGDGLLGWATFPDDYAGKPALDGVVVLFSSLSGVGSGPYAAGDTAVHEVGHWLGLFHTFQGGCGTRGDSVSDTPRERTAASGCPRGRDTCTGATSAGLDPVDNFMDYSDDACMNGFTAGQTDRMSKHFLAYRTATH